MIGAGAAKIDWLQCHSLRHGLLELEWKDENHDDNFFDALECHGVVLWKGTTA